MVEPPSHPSCTEASRVGGTVLLYLLETLKGRSRPRPGAPKFSERFRSAAPCRSFINVRCGESHGSCWPEYIWSKLCCRWSDLQVGNNYCKLLSNIHGARKLQVPHLSAQPKVCTQQTPSSSSCPFLVRGDVALTPPVVSGADQVAFGN